VDDKHLLLIGKIIGAHGIHGVVKVFSYAESISRYAAGISLHVKDVTAGERSVKIKWVKPHSKAILLSLEGIMNRDQAEALSGAELFIDRGLLEKPAQGTFYWSDIIGLSVYDMMNAYIGRVTSIIETGSNDVYVVTCPESEGRKEVLVPALAWVVKEIDLNKQIMRIDLPEGL
jgi:16S rRNA processing protein RimM